MMGYSPKSFEAVRANRQPLLTALAALAITQLVVRYEGGGDSGDVGRHRPSASLPGPQATGPDPGGKAMTCLEIDALMLRDVLSETEERALVEHLDACPACTARTAAW